MSEKRKKLLTDAFQMLSAGAQRGKRMVAGDFTLAEVAAQATALEELARAIRQSTSHAVGAEALLGQVARAKTLSVSKRVH